MPAGSRFEGTFPFLLELVVKNDVQESATEVCSDSKHQGGGPFPLPPFDLFKCRLGVQVPVRPSQVPTIVDAMITVLIPKNITAVINFITVI